MANIAISELTSETTSLGDNDYLLVSKNNGGSFTSSKMKGSVLKSETSGCQFTADKVKTACQEAFASSSIINENTTLNGVKSNFIDYSKSMLLTRSICSLSLPYDAIVMWNSLPNIFEIDDVDIRLLQFAQNHCYIENGHKILISPYNNESCWIIPVSYGNNQLEYVTNSIFDWISDSENRSKIDQYFQKISIWGGNNINVASNTEYTLTAQIASLKCNYWTIMCQPKVDMIIGSGGVKSTSKFYTTDYYVSGVCVNDSIVTVNANNMTNGGARVLVKSNQYINMNFMAYGAHSTTQIDQTADFFHNIQWAPLTGFDIVN